ncbi:hypothetical protein [Staphylococcus phage PT1-4]
MLRVRFFQDTYLFDYNIFRRYNQEYDVDLKTAVELFENEQADVLNPFLNEDLFQEIDLYENDWIEFCKQTKKEGI